VRFFAFCILHGVLRAGIIIRVNKVF